MMNKVASNYKKWKGIKAEEVDIRLNLHLCIGG